MDLNREMADDFSLVEPNIIQDWDSADIVNAMRNLFQSRVQRAGDYLARNSVRLFLQRCSRNKRLMYQVMPFQSVAAKPVGRLILFCLSAVFLSLSIRATVIVSQIGLSEAKTLRLSTNLKRNYTPISDHLRLKVLLSGCEVEANASISASDSKLDTFYGNSVRFDGWYLEVGIDEELPANFLLEASLDNISWLAVGASSRSYQYIANMNPQWIFRDDQTIVDASTCHANCTGTSRLPNFASACCRVGDKKRIMFDHRWTWPMLLPCACNLIVAASFAFAAIHGWMFPFATDLMWVFKFNFSVLFTTYSFFTLLWGTLPDSTGVVNVRQIVLPLLMTVSTGVALALICFISEQQMPDVFLVFGMEVLVAHIVELAVINGSTVSIGQAALSAVVPVLISLVGLMYKLNSYNNMKTTQSRFLTYFEIRNSLASKLEHLDRIDQIRRHVCPFPGVAGDSSRHRLSSKTFWTDLKEHGRLALLMQHEAGVYADGSFCIDRLQAQGFLMQPFLNRKVSLWSTAMNASSGQSPVQGDLEANSGPGQKAEERSAEKLVCSSKFGLSRPLDMFDLCRQRLVFEDLDGLIRGFLTILEDADVRVYDTSNTMGADVLRRPIFHACLTLYLGIITPETQSLGIANHICELQLMLKCFESIQTDMMHKLYIDYRNAYDCYNFGLVQSLSNARRMFSVILQTRAKASTSDNVLANTPSTPSLPEDSVLHDAEEWLLEACLSICVLHGNFLTSQLSRTYIAMSRAYASSALFTSTPLAAAVTKPIFQAVVFITGLLSLLACIMAIYSYNVLGFMEYMHYRLTVIRFRDGQHRPALWRGIAGFGLLRDMCPLRDVPFLQHGIVAAGNSSSIIATFQRPIRANGWFFSTNAADSPALDPVEFVLDGSNDLIQWAPVASESTTVVYGIFGSWLSFPHHGRPEHRGGVLNSFDLRPDLCWLLSWVMVTAFAVVWWWGLLALGAMRAGCMWYRRVAAAGVTGMGLGFGIPATIRATSVGFRAAMVLYCVGPIAFATVILVLFAEGQCAYWLGPLCMCLFVGNMVSLWQEGAMELSPMAVIFSPFFVVGLTGLCLSLALLAARYYFLRKADALILPDLARYNEVWAEVIRDKDSMQALQELRVTSRPHEKAGRPRQLCPPLIASEEPGSPIHCLNQLMTAAQGLNPILKSLCKRWALASQACAKLASGEGGCSGRIVKFSALDPEEEYLIQWAAVKHPKRAVEKSVRTYQQDPSFLVDLCRQTLIFQTVEDLTACLRSIVQDKDVIIMRVKNRMHPPDQAAIESTSVGGCCGARETNTTGYRDVAINLRVCSQQALSMSLHWHVAEVQLLLQSFLKVKSDQGHAHYVKWRNIRGE